MTKQTICLFFLIFMTSCSTLVQPHEFSEAKKMAKSNPKSAFKKLNSIRNNIKECDEATQMEYMLLYAETMANANMPVDTVAFMENVLLYYQQNPIGNKLQQAYYINGCINQRKGNTTLALQDFKKASKDLLKETNSLRYYLYITCFTLIIVLISISYTLFTKRQLTRLKIKHAHLQYEFVAGQCENAKEDLSALKKDLSTFKQEKEHEIDRLNNILTSYNNTGKPFWESEQALLQSEIVTHIHKLATKGIKLSGNEWKDMETAITITLPDFYDEILQNCYNLTSQELKALY